MKAQKEKYDKIGSKIFDMLIGVPLGALIASIIYEKNEISLIAVVSVIIIGIAIAGFNKVIQAICFYTEGYFKDKYLFDALDELNYSPQMYDSGISNV